MDAYGYESASRLERLSKCSPAGSVILDNHSKEVECIFILGKTWAAYATYGTTLTGNGGTGGTGDPKFLVRRAYELSNQSPVG